MRNVLYTLAFLLAACGGSAGSSTDSPQHSVASADEPDVVPEVLVPALVADSAAVAGLNDCSSIMEPALHARSVCYFGGLGRLFVIKGVHRPDEIHSPADALLRDAKVYWRMFAPGDHFPKVEISEDGALAFYAVRHHSAGREFVFVYVYRSLPGLSGIVTVTGFDSAAGTMSAERAAEVQGITRAVAASLRLEMRPDQSIPQE